jgi:hypothetical protein
LSIPFTLLLATWSAGFTGLGLLVIETIFRARILALTPASATKPTSEDPR